MDLIYEPDGALCIPAKLILCVHEQQASLGGLPLPVCKQLQSSAADLQDVSPHGLMITLTKPRLCTESGAHGLGKIVKPSVSCLVWAKQDTVHARAWMQHSAKSEALLHFHLQGVATPVRAGLTQDY